MVSVRHSFDEELLQVWCDLEWGIKKDDLTDELLNEKIDGIIASVKNNMVPNVAHEFLLHVKLNHSESDVKERVVQYFKSGRLLIDEMGWSEFFRDEEGQQMKCRLFVDSLEPKAFRDEVRDTIKYQQRGAKSDEKLLFQLVVAKAMERERDLLRRKRQLETEKPTAQTNKPRQLPSRPMPKARDPRPSNGAPTGGCLKCSGPSACPAASESEKRAKLVLHRCNLTKLVLHQSKSD
jgi:hypothetical protein